MVIRELTTDECSDILRKASIARLACARDNQPYVVPVHVYFDGHSLYSFSTLGQKIAWMRQNPRVCVQLDDIVDRSHWATVVAFGHFEELLHLPGNDASRRRARELFERAPEWWQPASSHVRRHDARMPVIYRIGIDTMSGRVAEHPEPGSSARPWWLDLLFESGEVARDQDG
jgi:nitroimidazol reductase NimA-like FMN-containing flavoprotein (pyridoxamine 5'-phosphate oxidase superfamily)